MARITRDGVTYHPDELDRITGEPLAVQGIDAEVPEPTVAELAAAKLSDLGATKSGTWWSLEVDGEVVKANGAVAALEAITAAQG